MNRFFIELAYLGSAYAGFQKQNNANSIQNEVEKALEIYFRQKLELTGSSRTDAGVHASQNFFHVDAEIEEDVFVKSVYHLNAILPDDIVVLSVKQVAPEAHCRFDAISRTYHYTIYTQKDPFMKDRGFFFPFPLNKVLLNEAAALIKTSTDFEVFSKKNAQVHTYNCTILQSEWFFTDNQITYIVEGNRFLRGMVRGLTGTMLKVGRGRMSLKQFVELFISKNSSKVDFSVPGHGLCLKKVKYG